MLEARYLEWTGLNSHFLEQVKVPVELVRDFFRQNQGVRIGETAVVSRKVHIVNPVIPEEVRIMMDSDAGKIFYQREKPGEIVHIDIFHQLGKLDPAKIALTIRQAIAAYNFHVDMQQAVLPTNYLKACCTDFIDIQTAGGGGRITGSLNYGHKESLRRAHENHVHITALLPDELLAVLFYIVLAVEKEIVQAGLEIRRNKRIHNVAEQLAGGADMSPYTTNSDSYLQQNQPKAGSVSEHQLLRTAGDLLQDFHDRQDLQAVLDSFKEPVKAKKLQDKLQRYGKPDEICHKLTQMGLVEKNQNILQLSKLGTELSMFLSQHAPEIDAQLKKIIRQLPTGAGRGLSFGTAGRKQEGGGIAVKHAEKILPYQRIGELAVPDTIFRALKRNYHAGNKKFHVCREDLCGRRRYHTPGQEICLLLDASASMNGPRLQASKYLVKHLLLNSRCRVAIVVFKEKGAWVEVPFTRDYRQIDAGLKNIYASGSTPLAGGIIKTLQYLKGIYLKNPSILLITDGVPTVGHETKDPMLDAIAAAKRVKEQNIHLDCIGLQPHQWHLQQVAESAGGAVYTVSELDKNFLLQVAWQKRV